MTALFPPQKDTDKVYFGDEMKELDAHKDPKPETYEIGASTLKYHTVCREWRFRFTGRDVFRPAPGRDAARRGGPTRARPPPA